MGKGDNLVFIGKKQHIVPSHGTLFVALDIWTERKLTKLQAQYISAEGFVPRGEKLLGLSSLSDTIAREWYRRPSAQSLRYKELNIGEALEPMMGFYIGRFLYYLHTVEGILKSRVQIASVRVDDTFTITPDTAGVFAQFEQRALIDAVRYSCKKYGIRAESESYPVQRQQLFPESKARIPLLIWNWCLSLLPSKTSRLYVSDYWSHIAPFVVNMDDTEVVFMDRKEIQQTPFSQLMKHRVRFMHPLDSLSRSDMERAENTSKEFLSTLESVRADLADSLWFTVEGINWFPLFEEVLTYAVGHYSKRMVTEYEAFLRIFKKQKIQKVLLRASIGGRQHHFFLITRVARELGIPTIELQHANEVVEASSVHSCLAADYLASYGKGTQEVLTRNHEYAPERIRAIGSPRFDEYRTIQNNAVGIKKRVRNSLGLDLKRPVLFFGIPPEVVDTYFIHFDSFGIARTLTTLSDIQVNNPELQIVLKFRPGNVTSEYRALVTELFPDDIVIAEFENPFELICASDIVLTGNSTLMYEGMQGNVPTVLFPLRENDIAIRDVYKDVLPVPRTKEELFTIIVNLLSSDTYRENLIKMQSEFIHKKCSFDGKASERLAALLREDLKLYRGTK